MKVELLTLPMSLKKMEYIAALAALTCRGNTDKVFVPCQVLARIIKAGHESILEHINLTYSVKGLSRACLQEVARHRHISLSVESTRHTLRRQLREIDNGAGEALLWYPVPSSLEDNWKTTREFTELLYEFWHAHIDMPNDELKYYLPEFWPTNLILTSNIRELRHILKLRTAPQALKEFRELARAMYEAVPEAFKYLLSDCVHEEQPQVQCASEEV